MRISQIQYFQATCRYNSVSKAAEALHVSQPSISVAIRELEEEFGVDLFRRVNKRLELTQEGTFFLEQITKILQSITTLTEQMSELGRIRNHVKIGILPLIGTFFLPGLMNAFQRMYPQIQVEILECGSVAAEKFVENGTLDLALIITNDKVNPKFEILPILETELLYCVNKANRFASYKAISLKELSQDPLIMFRPDSQSTNILKKKFYEIGVMPNVFMYAAHLTLILEFLTSDNMGSFLTKEIVQSHADIIGIPLKETITLNYALIWKKNKMICHDAEQMISFILDYTKKSEI
jgi:DNA-binding transcriptional LysR family regulator